MQTDLVVGQPDWDLSEATRLMAEKRVRRLPIERNGKLAGLVSLSDLAPVVQHELDRVFELDRVILDTMRRTISKAAST